MALGNVMFSLERKNVSELRHEEQLFTCTLEDYPEKRETGYRAKAALHTSQINDSVAPVKGSIMLYIRSDSAKLSFKPGDILTIRCIPERITNRGNPYEFDYRFYMENQGFKYMAFLTPDNITGSIGSGNMKLKYRALIVREKIIDMYRKRGIEDRNLALVAAMTVGDKTMLEPDQKESFIKAGIMHIMAVSGLHAVVLSMFVFKLLFFLKKRLNAVRVIIAIIFLWGFAFVTGLTPSVMRAALMFSFIHTGSLMKRPVNSMNSVFASAFVLILIKPSVIFDSGFLLSYFAVAFIIAFYKDLYMMFNAKTWLGDQIWQSAAVTLIAQAGVLPLTITFFNRFPVYFLAANLVIVPLSSLIIITGCIIPMVYPVMFLSEPLAFVLNRLTSFTEWLTVKAASIPGSSIEGIGMTMPECIMLTVIVSLSMYLITKKDGRMLNIILVFVLIAVIHNLFTSTGLKRSSELTVYNSPGETNIGIRTGVTMTVFSSDSTLNADINRHCSALGLRPKLAKLNEIPACIEVNGKKILVTNEITDYILDRSSPDFVILSGQRPVAQIAGLLEDFHGQVIVSSSAPQRYKIYGNTSSLPQNIQYVRTSGAYSTRL
jgi:competence protein ComEC